MSAPPPSPSLVVRDLRKSYGNTAAVRGVSFSVDRGEVFGLLGPNGAGKTTTVECVLGLREPDAGEIAISGMDTRTHRRAVKEKIGAALQSTALPDKITPREALRMFGAFYAKAATADAMLERFALREKADAPFDSLSGGQRQRLALALAFVNRPELIVLDEPTAGLDPHARRDLHEEIARLRSDGVTVMLTTHDLAEAERLCDRVAIIDRGRIVATGAPRELTTGALARHLVSIETSRPLDAAALAQLPAIDALQCDGAAAQFRTSDPARTIGALLELAAQDRVELVDLHVRRSTLEELFLTITENKDEERA